MSLIKDFETVLVYLWPTLRLPLFVMIALGLLLKAVRMVIKMWDDQPTTRPDDTMYIPESWSMTAPKIKRALKRRKTNRKVIHGPLH